VRVWGIRAFRVLAAASFAAALATMLVTCKSSDSSSGTRDAGKRDVREACARRVAWKNRLMKTCTQCMGLAAAPACGCKTDTKEYSGLCAAEQQAKIRASECTDAYACAVDCHTDCECVSRCYEGQPKCYELASAVDGCLADVCDSFCR
jgi:hypothetical protein